MPTISYDTQAVLAGDKVRFQGQEVAFVIATDEYSANDALAADRRRVRAAARGRQRAQGARPRRAADPRRQGGPARQPREPDVGGRRRGGHRPRVRRGRHGRRRATSSTRAATRRRWRRAGCIADFNPETGQLDIYNGNQAPHAHRTVYAHVAGLAEHMIRIQLPRHRRRLRQQGAGLPRLRVRDRRLDRRRRAGQVDRGPLREPDVDRLRPRLRHERRDAARRTARSPACAST